MAKILVTSKQCGYCKPAKDKLKRAGVKFRAVDIESAEGKRIDKKHNLTSVPSMIIDGKKVPNVKKWFD